MVNVNEVDRQGRLSNLVIDRGQHGRGAHQVAAGRAAGRSEWVCKNWKDMAMEAI
jgi:hypothetical protein